MSIRRGHTGGFTLLEILVALAVFTVMAAMAYSSLNALIAVREGGQRSLDRIAAVQRALHRFESDLVQFVHRDVRDNFGDTRPALIANARNTYPLEFTRRGWRNPLGRARSTLQRVAYRVEDSVLIRYYWRALDRPPQAEPLSVELLDDVERMATRFADQGGTWHEQWPPTSGQPGARPVPAAIEIRLELADLGEIHRLVNLPQP